MTALSVVHPEPTQRAAPASRRGREDRTDGVVAHMRGVNVADCASREKLVAELIEINLGMAKSIASRYRNRGIDLDDLEQVALVGLTKAAHRFDPDAGHDFMSYAVPTIRGELRRHFRDAGWMVRPPRRVQELQAHISRAQEELERDLDRSPRPTEIAAHLDEDVDHVIDALSADGCFTPTSLDVAVGSRSDVLGDLLPCVDHAFEAAEARAMLSPALQRLTDRERVILTMRFFEQLTQQEIGDVMGMTQASVSRVLSGILRTLKAELT